MKGLVTINDKSVYTNVAQAVFRLRKLNLGHSVDILFISTDTDIQLTSNDICNLIKLNDEKLKINKRDLLTYQTLKSEIRKLELETIYPKYTDPIKLRSLGLAAILASLSQKSAPENSGQSKLIYTEQIKYYFIDAFPTEPIKYLNGIVNLKFIPQCVKLFDKINHIDKLKKLVFNMDSSVNFSISRAIDKEVVNVKAVGNTIYQQKKIIIPSISFDYVKYIFDHISQPDIFNRITVPINKYINCVVNICTHFDGYTFRENNSGVVFVFIPNIHKLLLIPGYMAPIFSQNYILLKTRNLELINNNKAEDFFSYSNEIECFRHCDFINFITNGKNYSLLSSKELKNQEISREFFILGVILNNFQNKIAAHERFLNYNFIFKQDKPLHIRFDQYIKSWLLGKYRKEIIIPDATDINTIEPFFKSDAEYLCNDNVEKYKVEQTNILQSNISNCEKNKSKFQSEKDRSQHRETKKQKELCETNKLTYIELNKCEENKQLYIDRDQIELCRKYKIEYSHSVKLNIQAEIAQEEKILEDFTKKLEDSTNKLMNLYKSDEITQKETEIMSLQKEISVLDESITELQKQIIVIKSSMSNANKNSVRKNNEFIEKNIAGIKQNKKKLDNQILAINQVISQLVNVLKVNNKKEVKKYTERISKYEGKILTSKLKINSLRISLAN